MRLFHVSEESDIHMYTPRIPERNDLKKSVGIVWAIDEKRLPNFITPRDCPRITYYAGDRTSVSDKEIYLTSDVQHVVIIESKWFEIMKNTHLHLYEFNPKNFV